MPRVVVFSYAGFVGELLDLLRELGADPVAVVLPSNRPNDATASAARAAEAAGVDVLVQPPRSEVDEWSLGLARCEPDVLLIWSYSMVLPPVLLAVPRIACVNMHGGLLPDYRGGHVLQWAIVNGEATTGVTLHVVDAGVDTGPVIATRPIPIEDDDDAGTLSLKLRDAGFSVLREHWHDLVAGVAAAQPQCGEGRYWPLRTEVDSEIDWAATGIAVRNLVRALVDPWPGAFTLAGDVKIIVDRVEVLPERTSAPPGTIIRVRKDTLVVAAGDAVVAILEARVADRPGPVAALGLVEGDRLGRGYPARDAP